MFTSLFPGSMCLYISSQNHKSTEPSQLELEFNNNISRSVNVLCNAINTFLCFISHTDRVTPAAISFSKTLWHETQRFVCVHNKRVAGDHTVKQLWQVKTNSQITSLNRRQKLVSAVLLSAATPQRQARVNIHLSSASGKGFSGVCFESSTFVSKQS